MGRGDEMVNPVRCEACHKFGARLVNIEASVNGVTRVWQLRLCQWDWRAFEAMLDVSDVYYEMRNKPDGRKVTWLW